jgi:hypothetical protein
LGILVDLNEILKQIENNLDGLTTAELKRFQEAFQVMVERKLLADLDYFSKTKNANKQALISKTRKRAAPTFEGYFISEDGGTIWSKWSQGRFPNAFRDVDRSKWRELTEREFCDAIRDGKTVAKATLGYDAEHATINDLLERNAD